MGSNFIVSVIEVKKPDTLEAYCRRVADGVNELIEDWVKDNLDNYDIFGFDVDKLLKPQLIDSVNEVLTAVNGRSSAWYENDTSIFYIAGGDTWGDDPSDVYTLFDTFNRIVNMIDEGV
jgi:hypothetical protein